MFAYAHRAKLKEMSIIHFDNLEEQNIEEVLDYLQTNWPDKLKMFAFDANNEEGKYGSANYYIRGIKTVSN